MDAPVLNLHSLFDNLRCHVDILNESIEPQFIQMALNFEDCRVDGLGLNRTLGPARKCLPKQKLRGEPWKSNSSMLAIKSTWSSAGARRQRLTVRSWTVRSS